MITRGQASLAKYTQDAVFDGNGRECVITALAPAFDTVVVKYNDDSRDVWTLDELTASQQLIRDMEYED